MRIQGSCTTRPQFSRAQPFTSRQWPWIWSPFIGSLLHPAAAFAQHGNFLDVSGQYSTIERHAFGLVAERAGTEDVLRERRRLLDDEHVHRPEENVGFV